MLLIVPRGDWMTDDTTRLRGDEAAALPALQNGEALPAAELDGTGGRSSVIALRRAVLLVLVVFCISAIFIYARRSGDFDGYVNVGRVILTGQDSYLATPKGQNTWPPFFSLFCIPIAFAARHSLYFARALWVVLDELCLLGISWLLARLVYGRGLGFRSNTRDLSLAAPELLIPFLLALPFFLNNFEVLNFDFFLFGLTLTGLYVAETGREVWGGVLVGVAASLKVMPVLFVPYFALRRQWRRCAAASVSAAAFSLSPILAFGWARFWRDVALWRVATQGLWHGQLLNQSIYAMWDRFLGATRLANIYHYTGSGVYPVPPDPRARLAWAVSFAIVILAVLWRFRGEPGSDRFKIMIEWSVVFLMAALFAPVTWKHYLTVLWLPCVLLVAAWRSSRLEPRARWVIEGTLILCGIGGLLTFKDLFGRWIIVRVMTFSEVTIMSLLFLGCLLWLRWRAPANLLP